MSRIKIHSMSTSVKNNSIMLEAVVMLGETINETILDETLAQVLIQDSVVYFFPDSVVQTYIRFDS